MTKFQNGKTATRNPGRGKGRFSMELHQRTPPQAIAWLYACSHSGERVNRIELTTPYAHSHYCRAPGYPGRMD